MIDFEAYRGRVLGRFTLSRQDPLVAELTGPRGYAVEAWVKELRRLSGQQVDWLWYGETAEVHCRGDGNAVLQAILDTIEEFRAYCARGEHGCRPLDIKPLDIKSDYGFLPSARAADLEELKAWAREQLKETP